MAGEHRRTVCEDGHCDVIEEVHLVEQRVWMIEHRQDTVDETVLRIFEHLDEMKDERLKRAEAERVQAVNKLDENKREHREKMLTIAGWIMAFAATMISVWYTHHLAVQAILMQGHK